MSIQSVGSFLSALAQTSEPVELVLGQIGDNFDPKVQTPLGPWCFIGQEPEGIDLDTIEFVDPFVTPGQVLEADQSTRDLANQLALVWSKDMNIRHGRTYSEEYWRSLLILWLVAAIQATWRRYRHIEEYIKSSDQIAVRVDVTEIETDWQFVDLHDFMDVLMHDSAFDHWLSSRIVKKLAPAHWQVNETSIAVAANPADHGEGVVPKSGLTRIFRSIVGRLPVDSVQGMLFSRIFFSALICVLPHRAFVPPKRSEELDVIQKFPATYLEFLDEFLKATLPRAYTDDYEKFESAAKRKKYAKGRLLIDHVAPLGPDNQAVIAQALEAGERLVGFQHGGTDGSAMCTPWSEAEKQYYGWISWGWAEQQDIKGRIIPLPSPYLHRYRNRHRGTNKDLILVGAKMFVRGLRFEAAPSPSQYLEYRGDKIRFLSNLRPDVMRSVEYRPYLRAKETLEDETFVSSRCPEVSIVREDLHKRILACRLLVLDNPGTTLNIALVANIPTICFWNPGHWPLCRQAIPFFDSMKEQGMLFDSPDDAARKINEIWGDVEGWWASAGVQHARNAWIRQYAHTSKFWQWHWFRAICQMGWERTTSVGPSGRIC